MSRRLLVMCLLVALVGGGACNRNIEPYDPDEQVEQPDLSKIFPAGAEQAARTEPPAAGSGQRGAPPPAPAPAVGDPLSGTIRLADGLAGAVPDGAVLFVVARTRPGMPPTAVKRIESPRFPFEFQLGPDDRMIAAFPFEGPFELVARIDADGNATSHKPGDLVGSSQGHMPGETGIEIVIDEVL